MQRKSHHVQIKESYGNSNWLLVANKVREKSRECHNHKPQPFQDTKRKRKPTNPNKHKSNKRTESILQPGVYNVHCLCPPRKFRRNGSKERKKERKNGSLLRHCP